MSEALLDTNVLVHAAYRGAAWHDHAARLLDRALTDRGRFCVAPQNLVEFAAVVSRSRFVSPPMAAEDIERIATRLYRSRTLRKIYPQRGTVQRALSEGARIRLVGPAWYDLFLAATMRDNDVQLIVTENLSDFARIPFVSPRAISDAVATLDR